MGIEGKCEGCSGTTFDYECPRCCASRIHDLDLQVDAMSKSIVALIGIYEGDGLDDAAHREIVEKARELCGKVKSA